MKGKIILTLFLVPMWLISQTSGVVIYEEVRDLNRNLTRNKAFINDLTPQFDRRIMKLTFMDKKSVYIHDKNELIIDQLQSRYLTHDFRSRKELHRYIHYGEKKSIVQCNFMNKIFIVTRGIEKYPWKMTGQSMQVGQYLCHKAIYSDSTHNVLAWFTMQIPVPLGPSQYGQLPGLILHIDVNDGALTLTANEINLENIDLDQIQKPTKGEKVTGEEFDKIVKKKSKKFRYW